MTKASDSLLGLALPNGWTVTSAIGKGVGGSGGYFSSTYVVEKGGAKGFLKAFDFSDAFKSGADTFTILKFMISSYENETEILRLCNDNKMANIVVSLDMGQVDISGYPGSEGRVYYIIFEMADGDIRSQIKAKREFEVEECLKIAYDAALGLNQLHRKMVAHQDLKPSNVLLYRKEDRFKLGDLGCSSKRDGAAPRDMLRIAGDTTYAPPELSYGYIDPDFHKRRIGTDFYMFGNLLAFLFSGINITAAIYSKIPAAYHYKSWGGAYHDVVLHLRHALSRVIDEIKPDIDSAVRDRIGAMVLELCEPDLNLRGHPRSIGKLNQYSLERYVSELNRLKLEYAVQKRFRRKV